MPNKSARIEIQDLVENFRFALKALAKCLIRVGVDLSDSYSGDAWDDPAETLYQCLIVDPIVTSVPGEKYKNIVLPQYEMSQFNYEQGAFLKCLPRWDKNKPDHLMMYSFFGFLRRNGKFDKVRCCKLHSTFKVCGEEIFLWKDLSFQLVLPSRNGERQVVSSIILQD